MKLSSKPARIEKTLYFQCALGSSQIQTVKFVNYAKSKTEYICKIEQPDFYCERSVLALSSSAPTEISLDLTFEPSKAGEASTTLTISSASCGDYQFVINAVCIPPQPQGPLTVKYNAPLNLQFKNVFNAPGNFVYNVVST